MSLHSPHQIVGARVTGAFRASDSGVKFSQCAEAAGTSARRRTGGCQQEGSTEASGLKSARRCTAHGRQRRRPAERKEASRRPRYAGTSAAGQRGTCQWPQQPVAVSGRGREFKCSLGSETKTKTKKISITVRE